MQCFTSVATPKAPGESGKNQRRRRFNAGAERRSAVRASVSASERGGGVPAALLGGRGAPVSAGGGPGRCRDGEGSPTRRRGEDGAAGVVSSCPRRPSKRAAAMSPDRNSRHRRETANSRRTDKSCLVARR